ncbi:MAG: four helix bundle protein [Flavobacteriales bacterium]|nr:four helix bundle protein [Flavobacteriales bacterium]MEB2340534.1 four helix bundle protein [Flavobacteriia bacterium]
MTTEEQFSSYDPKEFDWDLAGYFEEGPSISTVSEPGGHPVKGFKDLWVWSQGMELTTMVYQHTSAFPKEEMYGLTSQLRRAAVSVPSNVAEGWARNRMGYLQLGLTYARGSVAEIETQVLIAINLGYVGEGNAQPVLRLLNGLSSALLKFMVNLEAKKRKR